MGSQQSLDEAFRGVRHEVLPVRTGQRRTAHLPARPELLHDVASGQNGQRSREERGR